MAKSQKLLQRLMSELREISAIKSEKPNPQSLEKFLEDAETLYNHLLAESDEYEQEEVERCRQDVIKALCECITLTRQFISKLSEALNDQEKLSKELASIKGKLEFLEEKKLTLDTVEQKLYVGQLAHMVDEALVNKVLEDSGCPKNADELRITSISHVQKAIWCEQGFEDVFPNTKLRENVKQTWTKLKSELKLQRKHFQCLSTLKKVRVPIAHPTFDEEKMRKAISELNSMNPRVKETCIELIEIPNKVKMLKLR